MATETEKVSCQIIPSGYIVKPGYTINTRYYDWRMQQSLNEDRRQNQKELLPLIDLKEEQRIGVYFIDQVQKAFPGYFSSRTEIESCGLHTKHQICTASGMVFQLFRDNDPLDGIDPLVYTISHRIPFVYLAPHLTNENVIGFTDVSFQVATDRVDRDPDRMLFGVLASMGYLVAFLRKMHLQQSSAICDAANEKIKEPNPEFPVNQAHYHNIWTVLNRFYSTVEDGLFYKISQM